MYRYKIGGAMLALAGGGFLIAEAVAASAWSNPAYSYLANFISDLEVQGPVEFAGNAVQSPLWILMSAAFFFNGVLTAVGTVIVVGKDARKPLPLLIAIGACLYGFGIAFDGFFHESPESSLPFHIFGAIFIGYVGNFTLILVGVLAWRTRVRRSFVWVPIVLGVVGAVCYTLLPLSAGSGLTGLLERFAAYPLFGSQLIIGLGLLLASGETITRWKSPIAGTTRPVAD